MQFVNKNDVTDQIGIMRLRSKYPEMSIPEKPLQEDIATTDYLIVDESTPVPVINSWNTLDAVTVIEDGKAVIKYTVVDSDIETLRAQKKSEVNGWKLNELSKGFEYGGHRWDCDLAAAINIETCYSSGRAPDCGYWTSYDNVDVTAAADFSFIAGMHDAMIAKGNYVHETQRDMKKAIDLLSTAQEVMEFDVYGYSNQTA